MKGATIRDAGWETALDQAGPARRLFVLGPPDSGKSSFLRALAGRKEGLLLLDLDPGQKMVGPPGCATFGPLEPHPSCLAFVFLGSTAVGSFRRLAEAGLHLLRDEPPVAINTPGFVTGPGARLLQLLVSRLAPDLVVALAPPASLNPWLASLPTVVRLPRSPFARRKSPAERRRRREESFASALAGATSRRWRRDEIAFEPGPPCPFDGADRPVCSVVDGEGEDRRLGILEAIDGVGVTLHAPPIDIPSPVLRLGSLWAGSGPQGWTLREALRPAFLVETA